MNFIRHYELEGKHAYLSPSKHHWVNDSPESFALRVKSFYSAKIGTILHDVARAYIKHGFPMTRSDKRSVRLRLLEEGIPESVLELYDFSMIFENLSNYTNDAVDFKMTPEVILYYSDNCFGTADTIAYDRDERFLRIHDLKSGVQTASMEQLKIYNALFCLEYRVDPEDIQTELRIYQNLDVLYHNPETEEIRFIMNKIVELDGLAETNGYFLRP